ncbi:calcium/proton exchanger [Colletotrichum scovillei]|uniref:calcium/proton exchanger n=1 Tax=Colletotrichum scovillei TaxID=1209932 RepID=UPI0015C2CD5D|nr:calcium/proton exchanger [Colletotrichum scovillei]KAF4783990.1 calcium/proton exchanger [Colletotrichum scovillei]
MAGNHRINSSALPAQGIQGVVEHSHESTPLLLMNAFRVAHRSISRRVAHEGKSARSEFHIRQFLCVLWRSSCTASMLVNVLWPIVDIAVVFQLLPGLHLSKFTTAYVAVVPSANVLGVSGQEFARKMLKVAGILIETTFVSITEILLFIVLILKHETSASQQSGVENDRVPLIQAAILGSILTNLLLCLGLCFVFGGIRHGSQKFHAIVALYSALKSETISNLPRIWVRHEDFTVGTLQADVLRISQAISSALVVAFLLYVWYQANSQHTDVEKSKFTLTESIIALLISLVLVTLLLIFLVRGIEHVIQRLLLPPLVEKAAEHLAAIDEAWVINFALYHCLASSIHPALFDGLLVILVGWALGKPTDLNFEIFMIALLVLSILVVGNFLRDGESNLLEGTLLVVVYTIIAIACWCYPSLDVATSNGMDAINTTISIEVL